MSYCPNCGKQISKTANFCRECGFNLKLDDTVQAQPLDSSAVKKCAIHPKMNASGVCCECGAGVCVICKSGIGDKLYCPKCAGNDIQIPTEDTNESVKDKKIQRELDWLQDFEKQYQEVISLVAEMQDTAKRLPSTSQESGNQLSSKIADQFKDLQHKFISIEKSVSSGRKPKSSDLQKMNLRLKDACMYFGIACVAYRKWAEKPSSSIEAYTNEKLGKAGKLMKEIDEQLVLLSNKPVVNKGNSVTIDLDAKISNQEVIATVNARADMGAKYHDSQKGRNINSKQVQELKKNLCAKEEAELLDIWKTNDRQSYTNEAFEAIKQLLSERGVDLPGQDIYIPIEDRPESYLWNLDEVKRIRALYLTLFILYIIGGIGILFVNISLLIVPQLVFGVIFVILLIRLASKVLHYSRSDIILLSFAIIFIPIVSLIVILTVDSSIYNQIKKKRKLEQQQSR